MMVLSTHRCFCGSTQLEVKKMGVASNSITEALDGIRDVLASHGGVEYSQLAIGPAEQVLVFGSDDIIILKNIGVKGKIPHFSSSGQVTDI